MTFLKKLADHLPGPKSGLARHLTILLINFGIIPLAVLFLVLQYYDYSRNRQIIYDYYHGLAQQRAERLGLALEQLSQQLRTVSRLLSDIPPKPALVQQLWEDLRHYNPMFLGLQYQRAAGGEPVQAGEIPPVFQTPAQNHQYLLLEEVRPDGLRLILARHPQSPHFDYLCFALQLPSGSGRILAVCDGPALWRLLESGFLQPLRGIYLVNAEGQLLSYYQAEPRTVPARSGHPLIAAFRAGWVGMDEYYSGYSDTKVLGVSARVPSSSWGLIVEDDIHKAYGPSYILPVSFFCIYILTIVTAIILGMHFSRQQIMIPLASLYQQITSLVPTENLPLEGDGVVNEIEAMTQAFGVIRQRLRETTVSRDLLAQEVSERQKVEEALRQSEATLKNILVTVPLGLGYLQNWTLVWGNDYLAELTGYPLETLLHRDLQILFSSPLDYLEFSEKVEQLLRQQKTAEIEVSWRTREGQLQEILFKCAHMEAPTAELAFIFAAMDITTRKRLEQESLRVSKLESLGILAGGLAHDFNNILTVILGNLELLRLEAQEDQRILRRLASIEEASIRARNLSRQLLTFAKGGLPIKRPLRLQDFLPDAVTLALSGSRSAAQLALESDLWPVEVDIDQIHQAINNILLNAEQAMPQGGTIEIRARNRFVSAIDPLPLAPGRYVQISITDHGCGIAPEHLPKIFDPYFSTKKHGNGLGLTTTYSIIKNHKGHIAVESTLGQGTTVHLYLPAAEDKALALPSKVTELPRRGCGRILVMDDEKEVRLVVTQMLSKLGYEAVCVKDGQEAITAYREAWEQGRPFDAVILDLTVPGGMGGEATLMALQQIDPEVKAIVSSGYSDYPVMSNYLEFGFVGMIAKPYKITDLSRVVHQVLSQEGGSAAAGGASPIKNPA